ncbi:MAG TPA: response regulator [Anaerolineae bacterium]|nr:response regulator [Anaerolineae bacterium]
MEQEKILVVDDDESLRYLMVTHLRRRGYTVESARDGLDALQVLQTDGPFTVLVTDLMIPNMNGFQLLREARRLDPRLEVIVITGVATVKSAIAAMREDGAFDYLTKPLETIGELSMAVARAITYRNLQLEREALQAQLSAEAERLQLLIANIGDAILSADASGALTVVNPAAIRLLGRDDLVGSDALTALPQPLATVVANWQAVGDQRPAVVEVDWPAGSTQMVSLTPMGAKGSRSHAWVMAVRDITHLKQLDELKMRILTEMIGKIQLPLAQAMATLTQLDGTAADNGRRAAEVVHRLVNEWRRIQDWTGDMLALVRYESSFGIKTTEVDLSAVLNETLRYLLEGPPLRAKELTVNLSLSPDLPAVYTDAGLLRKLLHGLISRAALRSQQGGELRVSASARSRHVWIEVGDQGPPVQESDVPRIFEKSFVEPNAVSGGTDLELALIRAIVDKAGGQVWVRGQGSLGSTIAFCLPRAGEDNGSSESASAACRTDAIELSTAK